MSYNGKATILAVVLLITAVFTSDFILIPLLGSAPFAIQVMLGGLVVGFTTLYLALWFVQESDPFIVGRRMFIGALIILSISVFQSWRDGSELIGSDGPLLGLPLLGGFVLAAWFSSRRPRKQVEQ